MNKTTYWIEKNVYIENRQREILQRLSSEYNYNYFVLWIVPEVFSKYREIEGHITIQMKNGKNLCCKYIQRYPYPNRSIRQLSRKKGNEVLYGIPFLFKTYEELQQISQVTVTWATCFKAKINAIPTVYITQSIYDIEFWSITYPSIYTINMRDLFLKEPVLDKKTFASRIDFIKEFDAICEQIYAPNTVEEKNYQVCRSLLNEEDGSEALSDYLKLKNMVTDPINVKEMLFGELENFEILNKIEKSSEAIYICKDRYYAKETLSPYRYGQWLL